MSVPERRRRTARYEEPLTEAAPAECHEEAASLSAPEQAAPLSYGVLATNTGVRLACTMAAMIGLFALFLCWAERESRVIRRFAVQSAALTVLHVALGALALLLGMLLGGIPYLGLIVTLICWLFYIAALILMIVVRLRLMQRAWLGMRFDMPAPVERLLARYY